MIILTKLQIFKVFWAHRRLGADLFRFCLWVTGCIFKVGSRANPLIGGKVNVDLYSASSSEPHLRRSVVDHNFTCKHTTGGHPITKPHPPRRLNLAPKRKSWIRQ